AKGVPDNRDAGWVRGSTCRVLIGVRLAALDAVADLRVQDDPGTVVDRVALLLPSRTQVERRDADAVGGDGGDVRGPWRTKGLDLGRSRKPRGIVHRCDVAALRGDELAELGQATAVRERAVDPRHPALHVARLPRPDKHLRARDPREKP